MKKTFRVLLITAVVLSVIIQSVSLAFAGDKNPLSIYVASDVHFRPDTVLPPIGEVQSLPGDPIFSHCNTKGMMTYEAGAIVDEFLSRFEQSDSEILLIPGDISEDGFFEEHLAIAEKLLQFKQRTGKRIFVIPGNHDIRTSKSKNRLDLEDFMDIYAEIGYDEAIEIHDTSASFTADLDSNYRLIGIDACVYREDNAVISESLYSWIEKQVQSAKADGKKMIAMVHHNVLEHFAIEGLAMGLLCVEDHRTFSSALADWGIKYVFTGHGHANDISAAVSAKGNRIYDIETGSLITYPNAYRKVTFSDECVDVKTEYIRNIDISLLPDGYTEEQLDMIQNDFVGYSLGSMRSGMRSFTTTIPDLIEDLSESLKIKEGTASYAVLEELLETLKNTVELPLYDKENTKEIDSVSEIAAFAGIELPESDYVDLVDIGAGIYAGFYAGDEALSLHGSTELKLLSNALNAILVYALVNLPLSPVNTLLAELGAFDLYFLPSTSVYTLAAKIAYLRTAGEKIAIELIAPVAGGIINDVSDPVDLDVILESYSETSDSFQNEVPLTFFGILKKLFEVFMETVSNIFRFFLGK
ncbi:MAG: metallophosphoesterase [Clostridia bacterium]|nr:metallophosphoesterase [Clostridia bacterium]